MLELIIRKAEQFTLLLRRFEWKDILASCFLLESVLRASIDK